MKPEKRTAFLKWYDEQVDVFDFKKELVAYCRSDVDILRRSMMTFRDDFLKIGNIDPLQYITIASVCMSVYRSKYMSENTIGITKDVPKNTFSKTSIQWLKYISETENVYIQHAMNGGEHFIPTVGKADGYCEQTNTVYEFQCCFWHGCPKCYTEDRINPVLQRDMVELQGTTKMKNTKIRELGYTLIEVYECELSKNSDFKKWCKNNTIDIVPEPMARSAVPGVSLGRGLLISY